MEVVVTAVLVFFATLFVGGLALLAQWARKNRAAEITLLVTLLFSSLLVAGLVAVIAYGNYSSLAAQGGDPGGNAPLAASVVVSVVAGVLGLALCVPPLRRITSQRSYQGRAGETGMEFEKAPKPPETSEGEPGGRLADPPVFYGLWLSTMLLAYNVVGLLYYSQMADMGLFEGARVTPAMILVSELPFVIVALCGVGFLVRRDLGETLARLGYGRVSLRQAAVVPPFVAVALGFAFASDWIFARLQPGLAEKVDQVSQGLFSTQGMGLLSAVLFGLLIGIGAAIGEETLFRGAMQPALGITLTSLVFASIHTQYGPSIILGHIFVLSVGLGLMRKYANTTLTFITHATYNFTLVMLSHIFGV